MKIDLSGKSALVTGSTNGIGFASAKGLAACGARVTLTGRKTEDVDAAIAEIRKSLPDAELSGVAADLGTAEGCETVVKGLPDCDILVNNAGIFGPVDFFETEDAVWDKYWQVNVMSGMRLARAYLPAMEKKGWGRVVFLGSESSFNIPEDMVHYGVTKAADVALARGLAKRMAGTGVTVNSVLPGPTLSDGMKAGLKDTVESTGKSYEDAAADFVAANRPASILQRAPSTEEVANMIVYACSPLSSGTTGASLRVEGGVINSL
ncbi:SDR family NAD(P)-dependent oxidoreductase [Thioclava kandeliae]|uniref:SDR family oxidoreductase n=1 Tax=Thioclava kandeliae TaxID=3070818 RepID=A0ABV1SCK5_9RHOB